MIIDQLVQKKLISPPKWLGTNTAFVCRMGSDAYGASSGSSDIDIYGFCVPHKSEVFPFTTSTRVYGFGSQPNPFNVWTQHHIRDADKEYDLTIYSIVKFFQLAFDASPNIVDALFVPRRCVIHTTPVGEHVRQHRKLFLSSHLKPRLLGYSYAQLNKVRNGYTPAIEFIQKHNLGPDIFNADGTLDYEVLREFQHVGELEDLLKQHPIKVNTKRREDIIRFGQSNKEMYHVVRLSLQCEQILTEGDLDLERNAGILKAIRRGEWTFDRLVKWFEAKEHQLEELYSKTTIPYAPDEDAIRTLLLECLEMHYGSIDDAVKVEVPVEKLIFDMQTVIDRYRGK